MFVNYSKAIYLAILIGFSSPLAAQIYTWVDDNGITQFSDMPPNTEDYSEVEVQINSYESPSISTNKNDSSSISNSVVMYSTSWCHYCQKARDYFAKSGIRYKEYDIEKSSKARAEHKKLGGGGVPVILVGNKILNGFTADSFEQIFY